MVGLSTHVLDTSIGKPANNLKIILFSIQEDKLLKIGDFITNKDGRISSLLLSGDNFIKGKYELHFYVGDYFNNKDISMPDIKFLDIVKINFGISNNKEHYHVPLLVSPYGYSTYRGS
tara:strand:- start:1510 stop:1863 length:354 start_codon:yes stop_codon:yes gene_type:complete